MKPALALASVAASRADAAAAAVDPAAAALDAGAAARKSSRCSTRTRSSKPSEEAPRESSSRWRQRIPSAERASRDARRERDRRRRLRGAATSRRRSTAPSSARPAATTGRTAPSATTSTTSARRRAATRRASNDGDEFDATRPRSRRRGSLQAHLHRQALGLRLQRGRRAPLRFLIESLNDDGYLDDSLEEIAASWRGRAAGRRRSDDESSTNWCTASAARCACCRAWSRSASAPATSPNA